MQGRLSNSSYFKSVLIHQTSFYFMIELVGIVMEGVEVNASA